MLGGSCQCYGPTPPIVARQVKWKATTTSSLARAAHQLQTLSPTPFASVRSAPAVEPVANPASKPFRACRHQRVPRELRQKRGSFGDIEELALDPETCKNPMRTKDRVRGTDLNSRRRLASYRSSCDSELSTAVHASSPHLFLQPACCR